jgi:hypothetical protein
VNTIAPFRISVCGIEELANHCEIGISHVLSASARKAWPNLRILELGDAILDRRGELVGAAAGIYRAQLDRRQYFAEQMLSGGRGREIIAALADGR